MLSIQAGKWRGRKLKALDSEQLRPTSSRVKGSLFNILEAFVWKSRGSPDLSGWACADLFAGVGGLGLEVLSRGAERCLFVEKNRSHAKRLQENIAALSCEAQCEVLVEDVVGGSWAARGPFDLILADPPYALAGMADLLQRIASERRLKPGGILLFEHDPSLNLDTPEGLELHSRRVVGPAGISVYFRPA